MKLKKLKEILRGSNQDRNRSVKTNYNFERNSFGNILIKLIIDEIQTSLKYFQSLVIGGMIVIDYLRN